MTMKPKNISTPVYVIDADKLEANLKILQGVERSTGCKILLAQKAFSAYCVYPLILLAVTTVCALLSALQLNSIRARDINNME